MPIYIWYPSLVGLTLGFAFMNIPPVADQFMVLFGVGYDGLALFLSGLLWSHSLSQIPAGIIVDRVGVFKLLLFTAGLGVVAHILPFFALDNLMLATSARFVLGLCSGLSFLTILKIIGSLAPAGDMAKAQGAYGGAFGFGTMSPYLILPYVGSSGWLWAYVISGSLFALIFVLAFLLPRDKLPVPKHDQGELIKIEETLGVVFRSKPIWVLGILHGFSYGTMNNLGQWLPSLLADLSKSVLSHWTLAATAVLFLGSLSRFLSGHVLRFMSRYQAISYTTFFIAVFYLLIGLSDWTWPTLICGLILAYLCGMTYESIFTMGSWVLAPIYMGTALGLLNMVANLTNVLLTLLLGYVREHAGSFQGGFLAAGVVAVLVWFGTRKLVARLDAGMKK